jgi:hypothetical protein
MQEIFQQLTGSFRYVAVEVNDFDYKIISNGSQAFDLLGPDKSQFTLLDCSQNFMRRQNLHTIADCMQESGIPGIVLNPNPNIVYNRLQYFPYYGIYGIGAWRSSASYNIAQPRQYMWSCLNRRPHTHRIINWLNIRNIPNGVYSMHDDTISVHNEPLDPEFEQPWQMLRSTLPLVNHVTNTGVGTISINHVAYSACYINVVTETIMRPGLFISEKTWKPVASGQFFIVVGCVGTIAYLRSLGVDVFDDLIDHSYDLEPSWRKRIELTNHSLRKFLEQDLDTIWHKTYERRLANQTKFFSLDFFRQYIDKINNAIPSN